MHPCKTSIIRYIIPTYYTSIININTTPSNELVVFWLLRVSVVLMISPEVFAIYVAIITIKMVSFIATDASADLISFTICLFTCTSTILIISTMITFISTTLIVSMITSIFILIISMIISISIMFIISLTIISISSILIIIGLVGSFGLANTEGFLFWFFLHSLCAVHVLLSDLFLTLSQF